MSTATLQDLRTLHAGRNTKQPTAYGLQINAPTAYADPATCFTPQAVPAYTYLQPAPEGVVQAEPWELQPLQPDADDPFTAFVYGHYDQVIAIDAGPAQPAFIDLSPYLQGNVVYVHINARKGTTLSVFQQATDARAVLVEILAHQDAQVTYIHAAQSDKVCMFQHHAEVRRNAAVDWKELVLGSAYVKSQTISVLKGAGSQTHMQTAYLGTADQVIDLGNRAIHLAPQTTSDLKSKGVLADHAKGIHRGLIRIASGARGSNGYQKHDTLLLSDQAEADAVPNLEIEDPDVACSHGATIGRIDPEQLFYFQSRGIPVDQAVRLLVEGFLHPFFEHLPSTIIQGLESSISPRIQEVTYTP